MSVLMQLRKKAPAQEHFPAATFAHEGETFDVVRQRCDAGRVSMLASDRKKVKRRYGCLLYSKKQLGSPAMKEAADTELEVLQSLSHPNCARYEDDWETAEHTFYLSRVEGSKYLSDVAGGVPSDAIPSIFVQMLDAIVHLHSQGFAHGALTPQCFAYRPEPAQAAAPAAGGLAHAHLVQLFSFRSAKRLTPPLRTQDLIQLARCLAKLFPEAPTTNAKSLIALLTHHAPSFTAIVTHPFLASDFYERNTTTITITPGKNAAQPARLEVSTVGSAPLKVAIDTSKHRQVYDAVFLAKMHEVNEAELLEPGTSLTHVLQSQVAEESAARPAAADPAADQPATDAVAVPRCDAEAKAHEAVRPGLMAHLGDLRAAAAATGLGAKGRSGSGAAEPAEAPARKRKRPSMTPDEHALLWNIASSYVRGDKQAWIAYKKLRGEAFFRSPAAQEELSQALTVCLHTQAKPQPA